VIAATAATLLSLTLPAHAAPQITPDDCFRGGGPDRYKRDMYWRRYNGQPVSQPSHLPE
jgi:hypothetical protein